MDIKEWVLDRIEQSFSFIIENFKVLFLPLVVFYVWMYYVLYIVSMLLLGFIDTVHYVSPTNYNIGVVIIFLVLSYLILEIGFIISLYKTIHDIDEWKEFSVVWNLKYGFKNIFQSFKTYYFIFMYVYFIPAFVFIVSGIYFIYLQYSWLLHFEKEQIYSYIWIWLLVFFLFLFYVIYRSNRTVFALISAIKSNDYSKENFKTSVLLTKGRWWRVFGNFFVVGLIIGLLSSVISWLIPSSSSQMVEEIMKNKDSFDFEAFAQTFQNSLFSISTIISWVVSRFITIATLLFIFVFTYFFHKRLLIEEKNQTPEIAQGDIV